MAAVHQHYRAGTDCGVCGHERCAAYVGPSWRERWTWAFEDVWDDMTYAVDRLWTTIVRLLTRA